MSENIKNPVGRPRKNPLPEIKTAMPHTDDWQNSLSGLGIKYDRTTHT